MPDNAPKLNRNKKSCKSYEQRRAKASRGANTRKIASQLISANPLKESRLELLHESCLMSKMIEQQA